MRLRRQAKPAPARHPAGAPPAPPAAAGSSIPRPPTTASFTTPGNQGERNRIDLLTGPVGQAVSLSYIDHADYGLMSPTLATGTRETPTAVGDEFFAEV